MSKKHIFIYTFGLVFLAELGDKTQIAGFSLSAETGRTFPVIVGASLALVVSTLIAVVIGNKLASVVPQKVIRIVSALLFIGTGIFMLARNHI